MIARGLFSKHRLLLFGYASFILHSMVFVWMDNNALTGNKFLICNLPKSINLQVEIAPGINNQDAPNGKDQQGSDTPGSPGQPPSNEKGAPGDLAQEPEFGGEWEGLKERLKKSDDLRSKFAENFDGLLNDSEVKDSYIRRHRDYEDIIVKDVFPTLDTIDKPFNEIVKIAPDSLAKHKKRNELIDEYRKWKSGEIAERTRKVEIITDEADGEREVLNFPEPERKKYLDETLTLSKEQQLSDFIRKFGKYDPDKGDLPKAIRDLYYENLQRLAYVFSADQSYFTLDYYQENLNKEDYLKNALAMLSKSVGSKAAAEILFTLENIYEIQQRAWNNFFNFKDAAPYLTPEQRKEIRIETLRRVMDRYTPLARAKKINNYADAVELYSKKRIEIMDFLLSTSRENYRHSDALFEKGRIYWQKYRLLRQEDSAQQAIQVWQQINSDSTGDFLNKATFEKLKPLLAQAQVNLDRITAIQINSIIESRLNEVLTLKRDRENRLLWK